MRHPALACLLASFCLHATASEAVITSAAPASSYAGQESRSIKALSDDEVLALETGKGMGLAKAAELNGYPGPSHVLQFAVELQLSAHQQAQTQTLFNAIQAKAIALGKALVERERALDQLFAAGKATPKRIAAQLVEIGALQARLRGAHLEVHLAQIELLQPAQIAKYAQLRGYAEKAQGDNSTQHHMH